MVGYVTLGTNDLAKGSAFYDALLSDFQAKRVMDDGRIILWAGKDGGAMMALCKPFDGAPASVGNGVMVALNAGSKEAVDRLHAKALELGGSDEGAPGPRSPAGGFYGGYFRDLDGNKLVAFTMG